MTRTIFAMAVAGLIFAAVPGTSQGAPLAPLPAGVTASHAGITHVQYWHHWHRPWWRWRWHRRLPRSS